MKQDESVEDLTDEAFECNYDWTCYRQPGSCKDCTHATLKEQQSSIVKEDIK